MANRLRGKSTNIVVWIILGLLIVGLTGFGIGNYGASLRSIGQVGDREITVQEYSRAITSELRALQARTGQSLSFSQAQAFGLDRMVLQRLVSEAALDNAAARIGLSVGDEEVRRQLLEIDAFRGLDGRFSDTAYRYALEQANLRPAEFDEQLRRERARGLLQNAVAAGVRSGGTWTEAVLAFVGERRSFAWARLVPEMLEGDTQAPTEAELAAFYQANPDLFTAPETRRITYAWLTPDMLLETIELDEDALRKLYAERADLYDQPERRLVERLVMPTAEDAAAAAAALADGSTSFDDLVASRGLSLEDVDLGEVARGDLPAAAADAVFALLEPGVTAPVETDLGPAIFRVNAILEAQVTPFEDARAELAAEYAADRARRVIDADIEKFDDLLASGATLEDLANETEMELGRIDWTAGTDEGIAGYESFRAAARTAQPGDYPEVAELSDGGIFALRVDAVVPPTLRPLDEVRAEAAEAWARARTAERLAGLGEDYQARLEAGESFADLGLEPTLEAGMARDGFIEGAPEGLVAAVFALPEGGIARMAGDDGLWLAQLTAVTPYDPTDPQTVTLRDVIRAQTSSAIANDLVTLYIQAEQDAAGLTLNQSAVAAVNAQFP